ncbi:SDR family NAD(P)-dependent oxidoreductase [Thiococcus pfennigii]|uniref:SDR family NAD(P)-dependent oxidoreductase n=1 Tax=Thiococcus pfennigii TaxID=1057 RepID=UPI001906F382|nr:SDR family NAD(P)-dependent oxidoreductase [Thiococcus pfennigii]MBK1732725.1 YciK family oxidoreductase [Thiococcus pfennigii]
MSDIASYVPPADLLTDRVILVTGVADTIGRAVALAAAAHGATVVLSDRDLSALEPVYDRIEAAGHPQPAILPLDLAEASEAEFFGIADTLGQEFGRLDGLVHCAAYAPYLSRIDDYGGNDWDTVLRVNLTAPFLLTRACLPLLREAVDPAVVFTADRVGRRARAYWGAYAAAKFGIEGLMQALAEETSEGGQMRVNSLDPGVVRSGLRLHLYPGEDPHQLPEAEGIANRYLYLLGPDSRGVTGQAF